MHLIWTCSWMWRWSNHFFLNITSLKSLRRNWLNVSWVLTIEERSNSNNRDNDLETLKTKGTWKRNYVKDWSIFELNWDSWGLVRLIRQRSWACSILNRWLWKWNKILRRCHKTTWLENLINGRGFGLDVWI